MKVIGVIPARMGSTRFPEKVIADILGKPMIFWVWNNSKKAKVFDEIYIATDHPRIYNIVKGFGGIPIMTSAAHKSGSDRIAEAVKHIKADIVVNIQGDEPLIKPQMLESVVKPFLREKGLKLATLVCKCRDKELLKEDNIVKVALDKNGYALYFSRSVIPSLARNGSFDFFYKHIGIYAYRKDFLFEFVRLKASRLEKIEKLEQLRVLENGYRIKAVVTPYDTQPVDMPGDIKRVIKIIKSEKGRASIKY